MVDACLAQPGDPSTPDKQPDVRLLKLHGSLNWGYCPGCKRIVSWDLNTYFQKHYIDSFSEKGKSIYIPIGTQLHEYKHCGENKVKPEPIIIPPTWDKLYHYESLAKVWRQAAIELSEAENIIVIGYSLPEQNIFRRINCLKKIIKSVNGTI